MKHNLDQIIDRGSTPSYKSNKEFLKKVFGKPDLVALWIADMDFEVSSHIQEAIKKKTDQGVFGYEFRTDSQITSIIEWYASYHQWTIKQEAIGFAPSVLAAMAMAIGELTNDGDGIIIQPPVYGAFAKLVNQSKRKVVKNPLRYDNNRYTIDFEDLENKAADPSSKMLILSNPHNPVGRVWTRQELQRMGEIAIKHDLIILSDDIHADIVYEPFNYTAIASISQAIDQRTITFLSPGKTFNISGISTAVVVSNNQAYYRAMDDFRERYHVGNPVDPLSMVAFEAGYRESRPWFEAVMAYIKANKDYLKAYIETKLSLIQVVEPEGTYLVWLDFRALNMAPEVLKDFLVEEAGLALDFGHWLGEEGAGFVRLNLATSRRVLERAMAQLDKAMAGL